MSHLAKSSPKQHSLMKYGLTSRCSNMSVSTVAMSCGCMAGETLWLMTTRGQRGNASGRPPSTVMMSPVV
jgi:hypothetical protein